MTNKRDDCEMTPNHSIERMPNRLRRSVSAHVKR
jgi:hypothetical protein